MKLAKLVVICILPAWLFTSGLLYVEYQREQRTIGLHLRETARASALAIDKELGRIEATLHVLALSPYLANGDLAAFHRQARETMQSEANWVVIYDVHGRQVLNTRRAYGDPLPTDDPIKDQVVRVAETRKPAISNLVFGPAAQQWVVAINVPVVRENKVLYVLGIGTLPSIFSQILVDQAVPGDWVASIYDRALVFVARSRNAEQFIGKPAGKSFVEAVRGAAEGVLDIANAEGVPAIMAFGRSPAYGWTFGIGVPRELAFQEFRASLWLTGGVALLFLSAGLAAGWLMARRIARPVESLIAPALALGHGEAIAIPPLGLKEADEVGRALMDTYKLLRQREKERDQATLAESAIKAAKELVEIANRAKTRFLAAASHDLRQPTQALTLLHGLLEQRNRDPDLAPVIGRLGQSVDALQQMLDGLLNISQLDAGIVEVKKRDFALATLIDTLAAEFGLLAQSKGLPLRAVTSSASINSDPVLLERILRNLLTNAIKYTNRGRILLGCRRHGPRLRLQVCDTGVGISSGQLEAIFEEFAQIGNPERDRSKGLGLGLSIVERLAQLLGHEVRVRSTVNKGSIFEVVVPLARSAPAIAAAKSAPRPGATALTGMIVVVDDDPQIVSAMQIALEDANHVVVAGPNVDTVLAVLRERRLSPDVIVADYRLGQGKTGIEAIRRLRTEFGESTFGILVTGDTSPERLRETMSSGYVLLHKPLKLADLLDNIQGALARDDLPVLCRQD
jgi:signal transduction histidine kinase/ActR/RegA family two-component response regulator